MLALAETLEKERISHAVGTSLNHKETFGFPTENVSDRG